jgi:hypothetical protein
VAITIQEHLFMAGFEGLKSKAQSAANTHGARLEIHFLE